MLENQPHRLANVIKQDELLTIEECDELAEALFEDAAALPEGSRKENLLMLAHGYRNLANIKKLVSRKVN